MIINKKIQLQFKAKARKIIASFLAINIFFQSISPACLYALTGGPSQPEVQSFEPVGTSDMVDPFSGDFNYNIPLLDIDGYPINISYHSGITMDQEASWVGLGWNINPGVINRSMRGIPDDFNGDNVIKELNMKPNKTYGINTGAGIELFGLDKLKLGINYSVGIHYNNYNGVGIEQGFNLALSANSGGKSKCTASLGITSSSEDGLSLNPSLSYSAKVSGNSKTETSLSATVGSSFNSRGGLHSLTVSTGASVQNSQSQIRKTKDQADKVVKASQSYATGSSSSFDFGMPTYTPQGAPSMQDFSFTGNFKIGFEAYGIHPNFNIGGYYSCQKISSSKISSPAYGYMNSDEGVKYDNALLDFNREKDGTFTTNTPALPVTNSTYDIYSVSGQGVGGSYRPFRSDLGHVYDPETNTTSDGGSTGFEIGIGNLTHFGFDAAITDVNTKTGRWNNDNQAVSNLTSRASTNDPLYEKYYFKEANEKSVDADPDFLNIAANGTDAKSVKLNQLSKFHTIADHYYNDDKPIASENYRKKRERKNQSISLLTRDELSHFGLEKVNADLLPVSSDDNKAKNHHIAEITTLKTDGSRYVYGIAAYNTKQEEVTFAVGNTLGGSQGRSANANSGLVTYVPELDNSTNNTLGIDNYFSNTIMPAYAHSYLLTAVLSPDYVDSENNGITTKGPSDGDIGNYTKFSYIKINDYNWRVPVEKNKATFNEGLKSDDKDDKANYIYGEKELWYLQQIETKNHIAVFTTENRKDGYGVTDNIGNNKGKNGGLSSIKTMKLLRKISLYSKRDYYLSDGTVNPTVVPIKEVHFEYDYSLCPNVPNNIGSPEIINGININQAKGKLTLKKIFFTYQNSNKARLSPYEFFYSGFDKLSKTYDVRYNPEYNIKGYDRWGNYKPNLVNSFNAIDQDISTAEFPYVEQDQITADQYTQAWSLTEIDLPAGGKIKVDYQSDDYAYVQNKQAAQMFKIVDIENENNFPAENATGTVKSLDDCYKLYFKLQGGITDINKYVNGIDKLYFRFLVKIKKYPFPNDDNDNSNDKYEYVSGYTNIIDKGAIGDLGWVKLGSVNLKDDNNGHYVNPIVKAAIQFGRLNMPRLVWNSADMDNAIGDNTSFSKSLLEAMLNSDFTKNISDAIQGPNEALYSKYKIGKEAVMGKSWIRLNNPNHKKLGGGCRVHKISISDEWDGNGIIEGSTQSFSYGQVYTYELENGSSSGVASYEPQLGGDENPWKTPVFFDEKKLLAPDDEHYMEEPFGESFFPSPNIGYSRVTVTNLQYANVKHHASGKTVHEFYTAKDFPTITQRTDLTAKREKSSPLGIKSLLKIDVKDYMTASQGYSIELNDMHGKPKKEEVYRERQITPITSVEYFYKSSPYLNGSFRLENKSTVIYSNGIIKDENIGLFFDFVSDMREHATTTVSGSVNGNVDGFLVAAYPVYIPIIIPSFTKERTRFRSAVITKVIQRFGILEETIARDLGSTVSTKNLAYDAETGKVLLTQTTTDFNDKIYSFAYPAYWYYDGMGPAYRNVGFTTRNIKFTNGIAHIGNASVFFAEGDELGLSDGTKAWVLQVTSNAIQVIKRNGTNLSGDFNTLKVIRSGRRNQQDLSMISIISFSNPLINFSSNKYDNVLQAQAMEFTNSWKTFCNCFEDTDSQTTNPYIVGAKGMYKNKKSYLYLTDRDQCNYDNNTNIRKDGVFTSFNSFYKMNGDKWEIDNRNWTYTSEVTEFSPFGAELENMDALGRYSSSIYGYNQTLPIAVTVNSKYKDAGFDNFEDYDFSACIDNHFKFRNYNVNIDRTQSHTGNQSIKVNSNKPVNLSAQLSKCDSNPCDLKFVTRHPSSSQYCYKVSGGEGPYVFDWNTAGCDLVITISDSGDELCVNTTNENWCQLKIIVTDKNNCKKIFRP